MRKKNQTVLKKKFKKKKKEQIHFTKAVRLTDPLL